MMTEFLLQYHVFFNLCPVSYSAFKEFCIMLGYYQKQILIGQGWEQGISKFASGL